MSREAFVDPVARIFAKTDQGHSRRRQKMNRESYPHDVYATPPGVDHNLALHFGQKVIHHDHIRKDRNVVNVAVNGFDQASGVDEVLAEQILPLK